MITERSDPATPQLDDGMREIVRRMRLDHGLDVAYSAPGKPSGVPDELAQLLLRVARECLTNVAKHARSRRAQLHVTVSPEEIELSISDDGAGVDSEARGLEGYGLASMRRALARHGGQLEVDSSGHGTTVTARVGIR